MSMAMPEMRPYDSVRCPGVRPDDPLREAARPSSVSNVSAATTAAVAAAAGVSHQAGGRRLGWSLVPRWVPVAFLQSNACME